MLTIGITISFTTSIDFRLLVISLLYFDIDLLFDSLSMLFIWICFNCSIGILFYGIHSIHLSSIRLLLDIHILLVLLSVLCIHVFIFWVVFELCSIPLLLYLGSTLSSRRSYALFLLVISMLLGSISFIISIYYSLDLDIRSHDLTRMLCFGLYVLLSVKVPVYPFIFWLPEAHVESTTDCSIILAAVLLKLSVLGIIRFTWLLLESSLYLYLLVSIISLSFASIYAVLSLDMKRVIAWSSVIHMNSSMLPVLLSDSLLFNIAVLLVVSHSLVSIGLFYSLGILSECVGYRSSVVSSIGLLTLPGLAFVLLLYWLYNIGFPLTVSYYAEWILVSLLSYSSYWISLLVYCCVSLILVIIVISFHCRIFALTSRLFVLSDLSIIELLLLVLVLVYSILSVI